MKQQDPVPLILAFAAGAVATFVAGELWARTARGRIRRIAVASADDARLRETVRVRLDQLVSHPRAIEVEVHEGVVRVSGQVLAQELDGLLTQLTAVRGVRRVRNALTALQDPAAFGEVHVSAV